MFAQHLIEVISGSLRKSTSILLRDLGELKLLQSSTFGTAEFALASYRKFFFTVYKSLQKITSQYAFLYPNNITVALKGSDTTINVKEFLNSHPKMRLDEISFNQDTTICGRFTMNVIDSIANFSRCIPLFSTGVLLETVWKENESGDIIVKEITDKAQFKPLYAVIMEISTNTFYTATAGRGAYLDNNKTKPSIRSSLNECVFSIVNFEKLLKKSVTAGSNIDNRTKAIAAKFKNLSLNFPNTASNIPAQLSLCYLASGRIDLFIDFCCEDIAEVKIGLLIALEAGAIVLDGQGNEITTLPEKFDGILIGVTRTIKDKVINALLR